MVAYTFLRHVLSSVDMASESRKVREGSVSTHGWRYDRERRRLKQFDLSN